MDGRMGSNAKTWLILSAGIAVAILVTVWATLTFWVPPSPWEHVLPPPRNIPYDIEFFYLAQMVVSTINVALSIVLLTIYVTIYSKTRSEFTIGLIVFAVVFLLNAVASNPIVIRLFGFSPFGLGPFALLPDLFALVALLVLLYLSAKY